MYKMNKNSQVFYTYTWNKLRAMKNKTTFDTWFNSIVWQYTFIDILVVYMMLVTV